MALHVGARLAGRRSGPSVEFKQLKVDFEKEIKCFSTLLPELCY